MMVSSSGVILFLTLYFFYRVLRTPKKKEPDSYSEND